MECLGCPFRNNRADHFLELRGELENERQEHSRSRSVESHRQRREGAGRLAFLERVRSANRMRRQSDGEAACSGILDPEESQEAGGHDCPGNTCECNGQGRE